MINSIKDSAVLNNGVEMPWLGLGVWKSQQGEETESAIKYALDAGYIHIDTASLYKNEESVGKAIRDSGLPREQIFVTTKLWNSDQGYDSAFKALETSLEKLQLDYIDLYLIHWPKGEKSVETWKAMEEINQKGLARAVGVSNFMVSQLEDFLPHCKIVPAVNQVEYHPYLSLTELRSFCKDKSIQLEAWSPIMQGEVTKVKELIEIGEKHGKSPVQVTLRWDLQNEVITIPKSVKQNRIIDNAQIFDFELSAEEMAIIDNLNKDHRFGPDPLNFDF